MGSVLYAAAATGTSKGLDAAMETKANRKVTRSKTTVVTRTLKRSAFMVLLLVYEGDGLSFET
jgi:hypothetical protein